MTIIWVFKLWLWIFIHFYGIGKSIWCLLYEAIIAKLTYCTEIEIMQPLWSYWIIHQECHIRYNILYVISISCKYYSTWYFLHRAVDKYLNYKLFWQFLPFIMIAQCQNNYFGGTIYDIWLYNFVYVIKI